jgi:hypothetical protein
MIFSRMDEETFDCLLSILGYLEDGRVFKAREKLEILLGINSNNAA